MSTPETRYDNAPDGLLITMQAITATMQPDACSFSVASSNHYKFTGKERDAESGLDFFGARFYSSTMGRWLSPDWSATPEPVPYANLTDPQTLNLYGYVRNNPMNHVDADGHCCDLSDIDQTFGGIVNAVNENNGVNFGTHRLDENSLGRAIGNGISVIQGVGQMIAGGFMTAGGTAEALTTAPAAATGIGAPIPLAGVATAAAGVAIAADGAKVAGSAISSFRRAGDFKSSTRENAIKGNSDANGGVNKCEKCGQKVVRTANEKGKTPPGNQLHVHHDPPINQGGGPKSKPVVVCRDCHEEIHNPQ